MCLAVIALNVHPRYAVAIAANRDEFHARPAAPAAWCAAAPFADILAGRDLQAGGTWFGVRRDGRWALVTNVREGGRFEANARSRGELVPRILNAGEPLSESMQRLATTGAGYNGFNLLAGDTTAVVWGSNRAPEARALTKGVHGLSNALLDTPWPKLASSKTAMAAWCGAAAVDTAPLFAALAATAQAPDAALPATGIPLERERLLSSPFIISTTYGTRCSTVFTLDRHGGARFHERTFDAAGKALGDAAFEFAVADR